MTHKIACHIADYLMQGDTIEKEDYDIYVYGYETLLDSILQLGILCLLGLLTHNGDKTLLFLLVFCPVRKYTGGYHAGTKLGCSLITFSVWGIIMVCSDLIQPPLWGKVLVCSAMLILTYRLAPIEHPDKPIGEERTRYRKLAMGCVLFLTFMMIAMHNRYMGLSNVIVWTLLCIGISMLWKGGRHHEDY